MPKIISALALILCLAFAQSSHAKSEGIISRSVFGCLTKADIMEMYERARRDREHMLALVNDGRCVPIEGVRFALVETGYPYVQIRLFTDQGSIKLWTLQSVLADD